jgi:hypothetical protein
MLRLRFRTAAPMAALAIGMIPGALSAATSSPQSVMHALSGNWICITHTSDKKTYKETDSNAMYGKWLKISSTFPAQNGQPAGTGQTFLSYDGQSKRWIIAGVSTNGDYFVDYSKSSAFDGSQWYDGYPNMHGSAIVHMTSTQYTVDSKGPGSQGRTMTTHEVCTKQ